MKLKKALLAILGSAILAFGLYQVHSFSQVTEGGQLGLTLLLQHWFNISPAITSFLLNVLFYFIAWKTLGKTFIAYSAVCTLGFSAVYWICEQFPPLWPGLVNYPLAACVLGALFVGVGTGLCLLAGGAPSGDDALVVSICHWLPVKISWVYLFFDLLILALSLTYIPLGRILYSVATATLSSIIIGLMQKH